MFIINEFSLNKSYCICILIFNKHVYEGEKTSSTKTEHDSLLDLLYRVTNNDESIGKLNWQNKCGFSTQVRVV